MERCGTACITRVIVEQDFEILKMERYKEMRARDSIYVVAKRRD